MGVLDYVLDLAFGSLWRVGWLGGWRLGTLRCRTRTTSDAFGIRSPGFSVAPLQGEGCCLVGHVHGALPHAMLLEPFGLGRGVCGVDWR